MDKKLYDKTRYQNIYRHKKNKNYVIDLSNPKTSISIVDAQRIFDIDIAIDIRDKNSKLRKGTQSSKTTSSRTLKTCWEKYIFCCENITKLAHNTISKRKSFYNTIEITDNEK